MTDYLLGECDPRRAMIDCNHNSFHPYFEHVFNEHIEPRYMEIKEEKDGRIVYHYFNLVNRRWLDEDEIKRMDRSRIVNPFSEKEGE